MTSPLSPGAAAVLAAVVSVVANEQTGSGVPLDVLVADVAALDVVAALVVLNTTALKLLWPDEGSALLRQLGLVAAGGVL